MEKLGMDEVLASMYMVQASKVSTAGLHLAWKGVGNSSSLPHFPSLQVEPFI